jgi:ABC-type hemin transport system ATPase subunit
MFFDRLVLLNHGLLIADGPPEDVLSAANVRAVYGVDPRLVGASGSAAAIP